MMRKVTTKDTKYQAMPHQLPELSKNVSMTRKEITKGIQQRVGVRLTITILNLKGLGHQLNRSEEKEKAMKKLIVVAMVLLLGLVSNLYAESVNKCAIAKATIATIMGKSPSIMTCSVGKDQVIVKYTRDDGTKWSYKCSVDNNGTVLWGMENGRWRNEDNILYEIIKDELTITDVSGGTTKTFSLKTLK
jgi:hypothetical protein